MCMFLTQDFVVVVVVEGKDIINYLRDGLEFEIYVNVISKLDRLFGEHLSRGRTPLPYVQDSINYLL